MSSRSPKDLIKSKWGSRPSSSKSDTALEKFKGEIAAFKTSLDEITSGKGKVPDKDKCRLLEVSGAESFKGAHILESRAFGSLMLPSHSSVSLFDLFFLVLGS